MRWGKISGSAREQPESGEYSQWKDRVAAACRHRCVYCGIHENRYGGIDNFHVDHYRPKSLPRFQHLRNVITNLYLSCAICNRFKSNDWPNDPAPDHSLPAYPDPAEHAYSDLFTECHETFRVSGKYVASKYLVERLGLNRMQLVIDRRTDALLARWGQVRQAFEELLPLLRETGGPDLADTLFGLLQAYTEVDAALDQVLASRPYLPGDQRKG